MRWLAVADLGTVVVGKCSPVDRSQVVTAAVAGHCSVAANNRAPAHIHPIE